MVNTLSYDASNEEILAGIKLYQDAAKKFRHS